MSRSDGRTRGRCRPGLVAESDRAVAAAAKLPNYRMFSPQLSVPLSPAYTQTVQAHVHDTVLIRLNYFPSHFLLDQ